MNGGQARDEQATESREAPRFSVVLWSIKCHGLGSAGIK